MSIFDRIASGVKSLVLLQEDVSRLKQRVDTLDDRERETRDRLVYLEGVLAGAQARAGRPRLPRA